MIVPTEQITAILLEAGLKRDDSQMYGCAGYCDASGGVLIVDESYAYQDTNHLIEDCVVNECYGVADTIQKWVKAQTPKK